MIDIFRYFVLTIFNVHYYDFMILLGIICILVVSMMSIIINRLKQFKSFKKLPELNQIKIKTYMTFFFSSFIILPFIFYIIEYYGVYTMDKFSWKRPDLYEKEWSDWKEQIDTIGNPPYTFRLWRDNRPPLFIGRKLSIYQDGNAALKDENN